MQGGTGDQRGAAAFAPEGQPEKVGKGDYPGLSFTGPLGCKAVSSQPIREWNFNSHQKVK